MFFDIVFVDFFVVRDGGCGFFFFVVFFVDDIVFYDFVNDVMVDLGGGVWGELVLLLLLLVWIGLGWIVVGLDVGMGVVWCCKG